MNHRPHLIAALTAALVAPGLALAQASQAQLRPPTDNELHAAYCITLLQGLLNDGSYAIKRAGEQNMQQLRLGALERLKAYKTAWQEDVDPEKLAIAEQRGQVDLDAIKQLGQNRSVLGPLNPRLNACQAPDWLPF